MKDSLLQRKLDRFPKLAFFTGPLTQLLSSFFGTMPLLALFFEKRWLTYKAKFVQSSIRPTLAFTMGEWGCE